MIINGNGACEFPIIYYLTACLYTIFGENDFLLKSIHLLIFGIGLFHTYKLVLLLLKDYFYAYIVPLFCLSSTTLVYYSFNYLPDIAALGFALSGWYYIFRYRKELKNKFLWFSMCFFLISSLLKVTYLINPIAIICLFIVEYFFDKTKNNFPTFTFLKISIGIGSILFIVGCWNGYVFLYNSQNQSTYFTTSIMPFWDLSVTERSLYWKDILGEWYKKYLAETSLHFFLGIILFILLFMKRLNKEIRWIIFFLFVGIVCYFVSFFQQFRYHDYYFLLLFPFIIFVLISFFMVFKTAVNNKKVTFLVKVLFLTVVISGLNYSRIKVSERYQKGNDLFSKIGFVLHENKDFISNLHLPKDSKIIIGPDASVNGGLYFIQRKGWIIKDLNDLTVAKIVNYKKQGATHLFIIGNNSFELNKLGKKIAYNKNLCVYKI